MITTLVKPLHKTETLIIDTMDHIAHVIITTIKNNNTGKNNMNIPCVEKSPSVNIRLNIVKKSQSRNYMERWISCSENRERRSGEKPIWRAK